MQRRKSFFNNEMEQRFSLRKYTIGLCSVCLGFVTIGMGSQSVKADTVNNVEKSSVVQENKTQDADSATAKPNITPTETKKNEVGSVATTAPKTNTASNGVKANTADSAISTETKPKQDQTENTQQDFVPQTQEVNDSKDLGAEKGIVKTNSLQKLDDQLNQVAETSAQHGTLESGQKTQSFNLSQNSQKSTKKVLITNLIATPPTTNGGFDEATWGKLDVNDWQGQAENGVYQLTGYTGDSSHIIVPNAADFEQAGKSTNGLQVGITPKTIVSLSYKAKLGQRTIAFSKTSNQKVKAIGTDWSYAFADGVTLNKFDGSNLDVSSVTNMHGMFSDANFSDLTSLADWDTSNVTDMSSMFWNRSYMHGSHSTKNLISDLTPLAHWNTGKVINMSYMFAGNSDVIDLKPIANWDISNVKGSFNLFADDSKLNLININNTPLMQGFLKTPRALQCSSFITNNADLVKAVVGQDLPTFTNTATRTITFYIPHATPEKTIQHIYYKTIAPVQIDWPIYSLGGGGFSSGAGSSVVVGRGGVLSNRGSSSSGSFEYTLGGGGFSSGTGSSVVVGGSGSSSGGRSSGGNSSSSGSGSSSNNGSFSGHGSSSGTGSFNGTGSFSGGGSARGTGGNVIIRERMRRAFANVGAPAQPDSHGPKIVKTYPLTDVKESDWQLDTSKQNDDVIIDGVIDFKPVEIIQVNGYKAHFIKDPVNPTVITQDGTDVEILEETANPGNNIYHGVRYEAQDQTATITYIDDTEKKTLGSDKQNGKFNQVITFEHDPAEVIKGLEEKGYKLASDNFKPGVKYQNDNKSNSFEVHLVHTYEPVETSQTITETVHYIDANGKPVAPDHVATVVVKVTGTRDKVTDSITWNTPSTGHFDEVISPVVPNMTPDKKLIPSHDVQYGDSDITESVVYTPDEIPSEPEKPNDQGKPNSKTPEKSNKSSKEVSKQFGTIAKTTIPEKLIDSRTVDNHVSAKSTAKQELPQTGATTNTGIWTGLVSMIAGLGLAGASKKRKKN